MIKTRVEEVTSKKEVEVGIVCDVCVKTIQTEEQMKKRFCEGGYYYSIRTGHRDWGNDSIDSCEHKDACSEKCMLEYINKYVEEEGSSTAYLEFERERI